MNKEPQTILAFDTAMAGISVGVNAANGYTVSRQVETSRGQASLLIPLIQEILEEAHIGFKDIDLIVSTNGPGSFTGLRIGLTTAKTLSLALDVPLVGLNTLDVMAAHYDTVQPLLIVLETKRKDFYAKFYHMNNDEAYLPFSAEADDIIKAVPEEILKNLNVGGDCLERFSQSITPSLTLLDNWMQPDAILMAQIGLKKFDKYGADENILPLYLREADVSVSKKPQRKLAQN